MDTLTTNRKTNTLAHGGAPRYINLVWILLMQILTSTIMYLGTACVPVPQPPAGQPQSGCPAVDALPQPTALEQTGKNW